MKTEVELLKEWINLQQEEYNVTNFTSKEKKLEAIERLLVLYEVMSQMLVFENIISDSNNEKSTMPDYMHISDDLRKHLDEVFEFRVKVNG
jgi:hypothetical protein